MRIHLEVRLTAKRVICSIGRERQRTGDALERLLNAVFSRRNPGDVVWMLWRWSWRTQMNMSLSCRNKVIIGNPRLSNGKLLWDIMRQCGTCFAVYSFYMFLLETGRYVKFEWIWCNLHLVHSLGSFAGSWHLQKPMSPDDRWMLPVNFRQKNTKCPEPAGVSIRINCLKLSYAIERSLVFRLIVPIIIVLLHHMQVAYRWCVAWGVVGKLEPRALKRTMRLVRRSSVSGRAETKVGFHICEAVDCF